MGLSSGWHLLILALVAFLIFGGSGRISSIMGDVAKGIKSFRKGVADDEEDGYEPSVVEHAGSKVLDCDRSKTG